MKKNLCRTILAILASAMLIGCLPVMAEESKSIDDMTFEELKIAYLELQLEYEKLKNEVNTSSQDAAEAYDAAEEIAAEEYAVPVLMDENEFLQDIVDSYNERSLIAQRHSSEDLSAMTTQERADYYYECASAEEDFYYKYQNAVFADEAITTLCAQYVDGIREQLESCEIFYETGDEQTQLEYWDAGYHDRARVIVELADTYGLSFGDITEMRAGLPSAESADEVGSETAGTDSATVQYVQQLLNDLGFSCGDADGVYGENTVNAIEQFRALYGYEPFDGVIDDELIAQLETALGIAQ